MPEQIGPTVTVPHRHHRFITFSNMVAIGLLVTFFIAVNLVLARIVWGSYDAAASPDARLVEMVQWTIGTVLAVAIGLVGFNWFGVNRQFDKEIERISGMEATTQEQQDTISNLLASVAEAKASLESTRAELEGFVEGFYTQAKYDYQIRIRLASDQGNQLQAVFEFCNGIVSLQKANEYTRRSLLDWNVADIIASIARNPGIPGLGESPSVGRYGRDRILTAIGILQSDGFPEDVITNMKSIARDWGIS